MRWVWKAAAGHLLSAVPGGRALYFVLQRYVTRSLPPTAAQFEARAACARRHLASYLGSGQQAELRDAVFLEFGAGWELTIPLFFASAGVRRQIVFDLERLARPALVRVTAERIRQLASRAGEPTGGAPVLQPKRLPGEVPDGDRALSDWLEQAGIEYRAPGDARATALPADSVDCVTSTSTLEHIPAPDVTAIFQEMFRVLRPGAVLSSTIDMSDHFSHFDRRLTPWNFLRFSARTWRWANSSVLYQNRLRASAYLQAAREAGFEIREAHLAFPNGVGPDALPSPPVHDTLTGWRDRRDLLATELHLVCRKPLRTA